MSKGLEVKFERELARIALPKEEAIIIRAVEYEKGGMRFDVRRYFTDERGELRPTGKGVGLKPEWLADLRKALDGFGEVTRR